MPVTKPTPSEDAKKETIVDEPLAALAPLADASAPANVGDVSVSTPPTVDGLPADADAAIPEPEPADVTPSAEPALPVAVQQVPTTNEYVAPAKKWAAFEQNWSKWADKFVAEFTLDADDVDATNGNRAALALLVQNKRGLLDAIAYQQVDAFISTLTI